LHRHALELAPAMAELAAEGVIEVEVARSGEPEQVRYRLPADEPTSVVARRLIETATHNLELRGIIAACLARGRTTPAKASSAAA
jgi:hypothetical protein